ncbi:MAG TPA: response regulator [Jatrophihabitantaceae bacterium]|nr:response regulator [Jatrophihabitantaceae bacterium]
MPIRVLLVDDVPEVRRLVRTALRFRGLFSVVGEAANGRDAIALTAELLPDVVVLDLGLPDLAGREVLTGIREQTPDTKVVVFSGIEPRDSADIAEHVDGYAMKDSQLDYLVDLLETVGKQRVGQSELALDGTLTSARDARAFSTELLAQWGVEDLADDVLLVVTELVNNAVTHAMSECILRISISPVSVRIEVTDQGSGTPDPLPPSTTRNHGRGLHLVDALTAAWGFEPMTEGGGKTVWAELLRNGARAGSTPR